MNLFETSSFQNEKLIKESEEVNGYKDFCDIKGSDYVIQGKKTNIVLNSQEKSSNLFELGSYVYCEEKHVHSQFLETTKLSQVCTES